jgi:hypothetical protein
MLVGKALADGKLWQRFYVSPDGTSVLPEKHAKRTP